MSAETVLGHFDAAALQQQFAAAGIFTVLRARGFDDFEVQIEAAGRAMPHIVLYARKGGSRLLLIDGCIGEATVRPDYFARRGRVVQRPIELAVVHWMREQDPSARFSSDRPPLPLQEHPGLGILRRAFRIVLHMANELGKDGIVSVPKFYHDAVIFYRSRLFLFLDPTEQGIFEALLRDLEGVPLADASVALVSGCVHDGAGTVISWSPGYQVFPLTSDLVEYFHSPEYAAAVEEALGAHEFDLDAAALNRVRPSVWLPKL
jgi:hypothetical protein